MAWAGRRIVLLLALAAWPAWLVAACGARTGLLGGERQGEGDDGSTVLPDGRAVGDDGGVLADGVTLSDGVPVGDDGATLPDSPAIQQQPCPLGSDPFDAGCPMPLAAGDEHTCALSPSGGVECWGGNASGQLGNSSTTQSNAPVPVTGLGTGVAAITAGGFHSCALTAAGGAKCWGADHSGELGDNSNADKSAPVDVTGLTSGVAAIASGYWHTCALTTGGAAQCWGDNVFGDIGDDSTLERDAPVFVMGLGSGVTAIAPGGNHTCAMTGGAVQCWGLNTSGQLGNGSTTSSLVPVFSGSDAAALAVGGFHSCAITGAGGVECWGDNSYGELGNGQNFLSASAVPVAGLASGVVAIAAGGFHSCALLGGGGVECWGDNTYGELGNGTTASSNVPVAVQGLASDITAIAAGWNHTCAGTRLGVVQCWGLNDVGQLGNNSTANSSVPVTVVGL